MEIRYYGPRTGRGQAVMYTGEIRHVRRFEPLLNIMSKRDRLKSIPLLCQKCSYFFTFDSIIRCIGLS